MNAKEYAGTNWEHDDWKHAGRSILKALLWKHAIRSILKALLWEHANKNWEHGTHANWKDEYPTMGLHDGTHA